MSWSSSFAIPIVLAAISGSPAADPFDDAVAAYNRGDYSAAARGFARLAEKGDLRAEHNLALLYVEGRGVARDYAMAMDWYRKSADEGFAPSQYDVGVMYEDGEGVRVDHAEAATWFARSAAQDYLPAEQKLADIYLKRRDYAQALVWVRRAAEQGDPGEQFNLGSFYYYGWGTPRDAAQARLWYGKAAAQGSEAAASALAKMR